jgi:hypothetical protein
MLTVVKSILMLVALFLMHFAACLLGTVPFIMIAALKPGSMLHWDVPELGNYLAQIVIGVSGLDAFRYFNWLTNNRS